MNNLKKKLLKMYSTLTIYQNAYRLKSGLLAGITGLSAVGYGNLNTNLVKSPNSSLKISEPLYQEADYIECLSQVLTNPDNTQDYTELTNEVIAALNVSADYKKDVLAVLKALLSKDVTYEINKRQENRIYLSNSDHSSHIVIAKNPSKGTLTISTPDSFNKDYARALHITFSENENVRIDITKESKLDSQYVHQLHYKAKSVNLVMTLRQPTTYINGELQYEEMGMNYNVTGNEYDVFKTIIECYDNGLSFSETSDNLEPYILNYEKLPFSEEENLISKEDVERKLTRINLR